MIKEWIREFYLNIKIRLASWVVSVEYRFHPDGTFDELIVCVFGACVYHIEDMGMGNWWSAIYHKDQTDFLTWACAKHGHPMLEKDV